MKHFYRNFLVISSLISLFLCNNISAQESYLDSSFGTAGIVTAELFQPKVMSLQQDGKILVAGGESNPDSSYDFVICRFNTDGTPDTGFGVNGKAEIIHSDYNVLVGIAELPDGKIVGLGTNSTSSSIDSGTGNFLFTRLNEDGAIDTSFGTDGFVTAAVDPLADVTSPGKMILLPDGKIVVAGSRWKYSTPSFPFPAAPSSQLIAVFNTDLSPDTSFNGTGYKTLGNFPTSKIAVDNDGNFFTGRYLVNLKIYRLLQNGQTDSSFGEDGTTTLGSLTMKDINVLENGKILISGSYGSAGMACLNADGTLDTNFGSLGLFTLENESTENETIVESIPLDNGIVVSGVQRWSVSTNDYDYGLLATTAEGAIDDSFGDGGQILTSLDNNQILTCITRQPDGKILAAGYDEDSMVLARYDMSYALGTASFDNVNLAVYPNPANDRITISGLPGQTVVKLYNISGQKLHEMVSNGETSINISGLAPGMYFLNTVYGSTKIIKK